MKKRIFISLISAGLLILSTSAALADDMPKSSIPLSSILKNLQAKGYNSIKKIEFEGGEYKIKAMGAQGTEMRIHVNPETGLILNTKTNSEQQSLSAIDAIKKVEAQGYHNISKFESEDDGFEIKAIDKDGKKADLEVDATGKITKKWF